MKKDIVEFVGIVVKINGKKKVLKKNDYYFSGWGYDDDDWSDSGVDLEIFCGKKKYKLDGYNLNY